MDLFPIPNPPERARILGGSPRRLLQRHAHDENAIARGVETPPIAVVTVSELRALTRRAQMDPAGPVAPEGDGGDLRLHVGTGVNWGA